MNPYTFILVGRSGAGKGTQFELLQKALKEKNPATPAYSFVMGDAFRAFLKSDSYASIRCKEIINAGKLMPDFVTISFFTNALMQNTTADATLFIDGIPRSIGQAHAVIDALSYFNRSNVIVIDVSVTAEEVTRRMMARGRADDGEAAIRERMAFYDRDVVPAVEVLKSAGYQYWQVDGNRSIDAIHQDIMSRLSQLA